MIDPSKIRGGMEVIGSDGKPVATVDRVEGNRIRVKSRTPDAQIPLDSVASVEGNVIRLRQTAEEAKRQLERGAGAPGKSAGGGKR
jgi:hypothetical protein